MVTPPVRRAALTVEVVLTEPLVAVLPRTHRLADREEIPVDELEHEPFVADPSHFRSVLHDAVEQACGFKPKVALVSFVAAGIGVSLVPQTVTRLSVQGAVYRPLTTPTQVELALAYRKDDGAPVLTRALEIVRQSLA